MTSRVVAIDTTSEFGSLAVIHGGRVLEEVAVRSAEGFGHLLFPQLDAILDRHGWKPGDVDAYAAAAGPGSFTGVRVGLAAVKGLGEALGKPVVAVSTLQAVAWHGTAPLRATVLDARRGEVYGAVYSDLLEVVSPEIVVGFAVWLETLRGQEMEFLSTDFSAFEHNLAASRFAQARRSLVPRALAGAVGCIAANRLAKEMHPSPAEADANYVRRSDAELLWKEW